MGWAWWPLKKMGMNNPFQLKTNLDYQQLVSYWKGQSAKPSSETAFNGLMQLAADSKVQNTIYHKDVVDAMFRQVNRSDAIAFKVHNINREALVYAVDYDLGPIGNAYFSKDSANYWVSSGKRVTWNSGWAYRNDGIDIEPCHDTLSNGFQIADLQASEWLQYTIHTDESGLYNVQIRTFAKEGGEIALSVNGKPIASGTAVSASAQAWSVQKIENILLVRGENRIRLAAKSGAVSINYLKFNKQIVTGSTN